VLIILVAAYIGGVGTIATRMYRRRSLKRLESRVGHERAQEISRVAFRRAMILLWLVVLVCSILFSLLTSR
jgi:hypothetical protein